MNRIMPEIIQRLPHRLTAIVMACAMGIVSVFAQNISQIAESDPLIITGSIGTNNI